MNYNLLVAVNTEKAHAKKEHGQKGPVFEKVAGLLREVPGFSAVREALTSKTMKERHYKLKDTHIREQRKKEGMTGTDHEHVDKMTALLDDLMGAEKDAVFAAKF